MNDVWQLRQEDSAKHCFKSFNRQLEQFETEFLVTGNFPGSHRKWAFSCLFWALSPTIFYWCRFESFQRRFHLSQSNDHEVRSQWSTLTRGGVRNLNNQNTDRTKDRQIFDNYFFGLGMSQCSPLSSDSSIFDLIIKLCYLTIIYSKMSLGKSVLV